MKALKILDCTLRDGGYYNDWDYSPALVQNYLKAMAGSGIDIVELGLRTPVRNEFLGPFAYTTDKFIRKLNVPKNFQVAVMINGKDYGHGVTPDMPAANVKATVCKNLDEYFAKKSASQVDWVRVAIHFDEVDMTKFIVEHLKQLGYSVGLNLMQAGTKSDQEIEHVGKEIGSWGTVDVLYFADSLGNMNGKDVERVISLLKKYWSGPMGIHTHNNMGMALGNSMVALDKGVTWIDATVLGMGRGAGNAKMEHLLLELARMGHEKYRSESLFSIVLEDFAKMQSLYKWGESLPYYLAAVYKIHPTYIQEILGSDKYETHHVISALSHLKAEDSRSFSRSRLELAVQGKSGAEGSWSPASLPKMQEVLLIANGPSMDRYKDAVQDFIQAKKLPVFSLNISKHISRELVNYYVVCNQMRFLLEAPDYSSLKKPIILPLSEIPKALENELSGTTILNYGLKIERGVFESSKNFCTLDKPVALPYALSVLKEAGVRKVYLAGFDGTRDHESNQETQVILEAFKPHMELKSITPTIYKVAMSSVFAPAELI